MVKEAFDLPVKVVKNGKIQILLDIEKLNLFYFDQTYSQSLKGRVSFTNFE